MHPTDPRWKTAPRNRPLPVTPQRAHSEAVRLLDGIRPTTRLKVFREVAAKLPQHPVLIEFFRQRMYDPASSRQGILSHPEDAFGDAFWYWKDRNGIHEDDPEWDEMSRDENFRKLLERAVLDALEKGHQPIVDEDARNYDVIGLKAQEVLEACQRLTYRPNERMRLKALEDARTLVELLK